MLHFAFYLRFKWNWTLLSVTGLLITNLPKKEKLKNSMLPPKTGKPPFFYQKHGNFEPRKTCIVSRLSGFVCPFLTLLRFTAEQVLKCQWCLVCTIYYKCAKNTSISQYSFQPRIICHLLFNTFYYVHCLFSVCSANRRADWICTLQLIVIKVGQNVSSTRQEDVWDRRKYNSTHY